MKKRGITYLVVGQRRLSLARLLSDIQHKSRLSTTEFAEALGVSGRTLEGWKAGRAANRSVLVSLKTAFKKQFDAVLKETA